MRFKTFLIDGIYQLIYEGTKGHGKEDSESGDKVESAAQTCVGVF